MMHREILKHPLLLKKYSNASINDYTEYPTKGVWTEDYTHKEFSEDLSHFVRNQNKLSMLYIHTPFCEELCYFCLCSKSITKDYSKVHKYLYESLFKEIDLYEKLMQDNGQKINVGEMYFGGGSPTYYNEEDFIALTNRLREVFDFSALKNFTVEIDPRRVTVEKLRFYHKHGVNRLSFGVQDFDLGVQEQINRIQPAQLLKDLLTPEIREIYPTINFDILVGLPKQTPETMYKTIEQVCEIAPTEVQPLYVHYKPQKRTYMTKMTRNVLLPDVFDRKAIYAEVVDGLLNGGYERAGYENFALPSDPMAKAMKTGEAIYNSLGTTPGEVINFVSLGSSAHGVYDNRIYMQNFYELDKYKEALNNNEFPIYRGLRFTKDDEIRHNIVKHFRVFNDLNIKDFEKKWGINFHNYFKKEIDELKEFSKDELIEISDEKLLMTDLGREFTPRICEVFDAYSHRALFDKGTQKVFELVPEDA